MSDLRIAKLAVFGANMARIRRTRKLTQAALAELVGLEPRMVRAIEGGHAAPSFGSIVAIADALRVNEGALFEPVAVANPRRRGRPRREE